MLILFMVDVVVGRTSGFDWSDSIKLWLKRTGLSLRRVLVSARTQWLFYRVLKTHALKVCCAGLDPPLPIASYGVLCDCNCHAGSQRPPCCAGPRSLAAKLNPHTTSAPDLDTSRHPTNHHATMMEPGYAAVFADEMAEQAGDCDGVVICSTATDYP